MKKVLSEFVKIRRIKAGGSEHPSYRRIDSHSVKTTQACEQRGIGGRKKIKEPKRHSIVDTQGTLVHATVHDANQRDTVRGCTIFQEALQHYPTLKGVCADTGYGKPMLAFVRNSLNKTIEISEPQDGLRSPKDGFLNEPWLGSSIIQVCLKNTKVL
ncbi:transposase [Holospora curviuscula]|uniref:Transposase IS4-like domain-containing protein n=1 Tax=Holospora curviuscula TaxID=1082868 RepID=A0A2S5RE16_9PROT|nr:transposase [Holospora curviuscula]PPE05561.1 hypothetical protein HCUR_00207 [Holospora curviuscula]